MGLIFAKDHAQQVSNSVIDPQQYLHAIVAFLDSKLSTDVTNIVVGFIGHGDVDFVFDDAVKHANVAIKQTGCDTLHIFDTHISFFGYVYDNQRLASCTLKWNREVLSTEFEISGPHFTRGGYRESTFFEHHSFKSRIENFSQKQRFSIRIKNVGDTTHYIIHDNKDLGSRLHQYAPVRFAHTTKCAFTPTD